MNTYVTYFDAAYAARARVMIESLRAAGDAQRVVAVCFDDSAQQLCASWLIDKVDAVSIDDVVASFPLLTEVRAERSRAEWFFTCTPWVMRYVCDDLSEGEWLTYLDADLVFHANPQPVFDEMGVGDAGIIEHRFRADQQSLERFGRYNVGWVSIRNSRHGRRLLRWWADRCVEWCSDTPRGGLFADQGYLNHFEVVIPTVHVISNPGANLAPWNLDSHAVSEAQDGSVLVDGVALLFFHAHGLRLHDNSYYAMHRRFGTSANQAVRDRVYAPYVHALVRAGDASSPSAAVRGRGVRGVAARMRRRWHYSQSRADGDVWTALDTGFTTEVAESTAE